MVDSFLNLFGISLVMTNFAECIAVIIRLTIGMFILRTVFEFISYLMPYGSRGIFRGI